MHVRRVLSKEDLVRLWPVLKPKFEKVSAKSPDNVTPEEIYTLAMRGECEVFYTFDEDTNDILIALAVQPIMERGKLMYFVLSLGGERFEEFMNTSWKDICAWMKLNGAYYTETMVRPGLCRWLRKFGVEYKVSLMHLDLLE